MNRKIMIDSFIRFMLCMCMMSCGGKSKDGTDGDVHTDDISIPDDVQAEPGQDLPGEDIVAPDPAEDPVLDERDLHEEPLRDVMPEEGPEIEDGREEEIEGPCIPLEGSIENTYSWTLAFMGTGTNATFRLNLSNINPAGETCRLSGINFYEARLKNESDDAVIVTYDSIEATSGTLPSTLDPGESSSVEYVVRYSESTVDRCDQMVYLELAIDYDVDGAAATALKLPGDPVRHECVY